MHNYDCGQYRLKCKGQKQLDQAEMILKGTIDWVPALETLYPQGEHGATYNNKCAIVNQRDSFSGLPRGLHDSHSGFFLLGMGEITMAHAYAECQTALMLATRLN